MSYERARKMAHCGRLFGSVGFGGFPLFLAGGAKRET
jgi:hypothetical protein